ncbi:hypothetical protein RHGRI_027213 [Rhododendron griersonianum]|uniref:Uncharacterized protein n=1 Tax=Rhododendron griersonianum TaxID=479676 RepID=A0AAV6IVB4_9ERIC|nr:hypothetical protein RHGRI_027213 [Rhododendron griersonianum]
MVPSVFNLSVFLSMVSHISHGSSSVKICHGALLPALYISRSITTSQGRDLPADFLLR